MARSTIGESCSLLLVEVVGETRYLERAIRIILQGKEVRVVATFGMRRAYARRSPFAVVDRISDSELGQA